MTHIEQAIREAVETGWRPSKYQHDLDYVGNKAAYFFEHQSGDKRFPSEGTWLSEIFMSPLFWQALGKAKGWDEGKYWDEIYPNSPYQWMWQHIWHRFIDHLAEGKDAESFFASL
jgi:hypothetical protein